MQARLSPNHSTKTGLSPKPSFRQEEVQAALRAGDPDIFVNDSEEDPGASDVSSDGEFGLKKGAEEAPPAKAKVVNKAKSKSAPAAAVAATSSKQAKKTEKLVQSTSATPSRESVEKAMEAARAALSALAGLQPAQLWAGAVKVKEIESRTNKAMQVVCSLEKFPNDPAAKMQGQSLKTQADNIVKWADVVSGLRELVQQDPTRVFDMDLDAVVLVISLPADCLSTILTDIGKKMVEAGYVAEHLQML